MDNNPINNPQNPFPPQQPQQDFGQPNSQPIGQPTNPQMMGSAPRPIGQPTNPQMMMGPTPQPNPISPQTISSGPIQQNPYVMPGAQSTNNKKIFLIIGIIVAVVVAFIIGWFVFTKIFGSKAKTMAEFEQIMTSLGYEKSTYSWASYSSSDGKYTTYNKGNDCMVVFYETNSRAAIKSMITTELGSEKEAEVLFKDFDFSKDYNASESCFYANPTVCYNVIHRENTLLLVGVQADTESAAKAEIKKVVSALNY